MVERMLSPHFHSLEQLVANWPDAVLVFDAEARRYLIVNVAAVDLLGYSHDELLGMLPADLSHPDDADGIPSVIEQVERDGSVRRPWRAVRKDGTVVQTEMTLTRCRIDGRTVSHGIFRTAGTGSSLPREAANGHAEGHLSLLDQTGLTVVALDRHGVITHWNAAATEVYGLAASEAIGRPVLDLAHTDEARAEVTSLMSQHTSRDEWVSKMVIRPRHAGPIEAMVTGAVIRSEDGEFDGLLFVTAPLDTAARLPAPRMRRAKVQCAACGREVAGTMRRKYCSEKCRQWAYYHRHVDAQRARSRERHERRRADDGDTVSPDSP